MLSPRFEERQAFSVMGIHARIDPRTADWNKLWHDEFGARAQEIATVGLGPTCFGLYFCTDQPGIDDFVAGMAVPSGTQAPQGLVVREVPAATYAVFECAIGALGPTWGAIHGEWLPASEYALDAGKPAFEEFRPGFERGETPVLVCVPVRRKVE